MSQIITAPTEIALWQELVHEAEQVNHTMLTEELESYLVFMLMRFMENPQLAASILAEEFLYSQQTIGEQQRSLLRDVGDKCLLYAGLYPKRAHNKRVEISYFVNLGRSAYANLAELQLNSLKDLFNKLKEQFIKLMEVLQTLRDFGPSIASLTPLEAFELSTLTGSQRATAILRQYLRDNKSYILK